MLYGGRPSSTVFCVIFYFKSCDVSNGRLLFSSQGIRWGMQSSKVARAHCIGARPQVRRSSRKLFSSITKVSVIFHIFFFVADDIAS